MMELILYGLIIVAAIVVAMQGIASLSVWIRTRPRPNAPTMKGVYCRRCGGFGCDQCSR